MSSIIEALLGILAARMTISAMMITIKGLMIISIASMTKIIAPKITILARTTTTFEALITIIAAMTHSIATVITIIAEVMTIFIPVMTWTAHSGAFCGRDPPFPLPPQPCMPLARNLVRVSRPPVDAREQLGPPDQMNLPSSPSCSLFRLEARPGPTVACEQSIRGNCMKKIAVGLLPLLIGLSSCSSSPPSPLIGTWKFDRDLTVNSVHGESAAQQITRRNLDQLPGPDTTMTFTGQSGTFDAPTSQISHTEFTYAVHATDALSVTIVLPDIGNGQQKTDTFHFEGNDVMWTENENQIQTLPSTSLRQYYRRQH